MGVIIYLDFPICQDEMNLIREGDTVTGEAIHFDIRQRLTAKVTYMKVPTEFVDIIE